MVGTSKTYKVISYVVMSLWAAIIILPFLLLLMSSLTDEQVLVANGYLSMADLKAAGLDDLLGLPEIDADELREAWRSLEQE